MTSADSSVFRIGFAAVRPPSGKSAGIKGRGELEIIDNDRARLTLFAKRYLLGLLLTVPMAAALIALSFWVLFTLFGRSHSAVTIVTIAVCMNLSLFLTRKKQIIEIDRTGQDSVCTVTDKAIFLRLPNDKWLAVGRDNEDLLNALKGFETPCTDG